ncbi:hypothetical protein GVN16_01645 [Emticicia sp. CRIBPO]|uniref:hypothetical protein n=1 Tax=Emticicia sp. CRIBPO TaxID=2683258 RepID=UPI0014121E11|nr:hypothetical protein [Emticicia sp. CRIBPO]NBA84443.1 hypothetical protein [Emticicia sp. CRIBPO]
MSKLNPEWLTEQLIDPEYKKYVILAYLKSVKENFDQKKLFPDLKEIENHYSASLDIKEKKKTLKGQFPQKISDINFSNFQLIRESLTGEDLEDLDIILDYAIPRFKHVMQLGAEIDGMVSDSLKVSPVGIVPLHLDEGYILLYEEIINETRIYKFKVTVFESAREQHRRVNTTFIASTPKTITNSFENIKLQLIKNNRSIPNPATYLVESRFIYPLEETLLPIARRKVAQYISTIS